MRRAAALVVAVLLGGCAVGVPHGEEPAAAPAATVVVERQDLTALDELAGQLGYVDGGPLIAGRDGVVTWLPAVGSLVGRGEVIAEIDGAATRLLFGERPAWRRLAVGERDGPDIRQLNDNLAALGLADRAALPDQGFDWRTRDAVRRWRQGLGLPRTGAVELGDVLFAPAPVRIGTVEAPPGTWIGAGQVLAGTTGTERVVTVEVDAARIASVPAGAAVAVTLPDRTRLDATVRAVGRIVSPPDSSDERPAVSVEIVPAALPEGLDAAPVTVTVERVLAAGVLTVPVVALLAVAGGGYAVERAGAGGIEQVAVVPGQFAGGLVEVTGDLREGDAVVVPS